VLHASRKLARGTMHQRVPGCNSNPAPQWEVQVQPPHRERSFDFIGIPSYSYKPFLPLFPYDSVMALPHPTPVPADRPGADLGALRREIDGIDEALHDLLIRRADVSREVARAKLREGGNAAPLFRSGREADIIRRLLARNRAPVAPELILGVWRPIIVASTRLQGAFAVAVSAGARGAAAAVVDVARDHFGAASLRELATAEAVIDAVAKGRIPLGVVPLPRGGRERAWWWTFEPGKVQILARLPFLRTASASPAGDALVIGRQPFDPSGDDRLYVGLATESRGPAALRAAAAAGLHAVKPVASVRDRRRWLHLVETVAPLGDVKCGPNVRLLGGYAVPMALTPAKRK
jgi:chorismate mutase / prephenate dehydratase